MRAGGDQWEEGVTMNRYITDGILRDLELGRSVLIASPTEAEARDLYLAVTERGDFDKVYKAHYKCRAQHLSGAQLHAVGINGTGYRGVSVDIIVMLSAHAMTEQHRTDLVPAINASEHGELIAA